MGNSVARLGYVAVCVVTIVCVLFLAYFVHADSRSSDRAPSRDDIAQRLVKLLCDRQAALGRRLPFPLIDPSLCTAQNPEPTLTFTATPTVITTGNSSNLAWSTTNATSCTASDGWSGAKNTSGNQNVSPISNTTYTLQCSGAGGSVTKSVTVTVNPVVPQTATLIVKKVVIRDDGGTAATSTFSFMVNGGVATAFESDGQNDLTVSPGTYTVTETAASGFTTTYSNCSNVSLLAGETKSCTVTNNDNPPALASLTLVKAVINNNGGTSTPSQWTLSADGPTDISGTTTSATVTNAAVSPGTYLLTESGGPAGYSTSPYSCVKNGADPVSGDSINLAAGDTATCTVTNNDIAPELALFKTVINDNGGTASTTDFQGKIDGNNVPWQVSELLDVGVHTASEVATTSYTASIWGGDCAANGTVTLALGQKKTCTITNNDNPPQGTASEMTFVAAPTSVTPGAGTATSTLTWTSSNANLCEASNGWTGSRALLGSEIVTPSATTTYQLDCGNNFGTTTKTVTVNFVPTPVQPAEGKLLITEVMYDLTSSTTTPQGSEPLNEWVELFNGTNATINLSGYFVSDASGTDALPNVNLPASKYAFITSSTTTAPFWSIPGDAVVIVLPNSIGSNGLGNTGDRVILTNAASSTVDSVSWGSDVSQLNPSVNPGSTADDFPGQSIGRIDVTVDTDTASDWARKTSPTPGQ